MHLVIARVRAAVRALTYPHHQVLANLQPWIENENLGTGLGFSLEPRGCLLKCAFQSLGVISTVGGPLYEP